MNPSAIPPDVDPDPWGLGVPSYPKIDFAPALAPKVARLLMAVSRAEGGLTGFIKEADAKEHATEYLRIKESVIRSSPFSTSKRDEGMSLTLDYIQNSHRWPRGSAIWAHGRSEAEKHLLMAATGEKGAAKAIRFFSQVGRLLDEDALKKPATSYADVHPAWRWLVRELWLPELRCDWPGSFPNEGEETLQPLPPPRLVWPGLAYCKPSARMDALRLLLGDKLCPTSSSLESFIRKTADLHPAKPAGWVVRRFKRTSDGSWFAS